MSAAPVTWLTLDEVKERWEEAEGLDGPILLQLVDSAREQCIEYAPVLSEGEPVPENWRLAHLMQVQGLWRSAQSGPGDQVGADFTITVYPMDRTVKNLLRPRRAIPVVG